MKERNVVSAVSTGGGGDQFEQHVAAFALGLLLVRGIPPVLTDTSVVEVQLQTGHLNWQTDDLLIVGERSDGSRRRLALQVKRSLRVSASDDEWRKTVIGMWNDFLSNRFDESCDELAVATLHGTSVILRDFVSLLECARASRDAQDFSRRLSLDRFLSSKAKSQDRAILATLSDEGVQPFDDDLYFRFLRTINVLSFDLNTPTAQTKALLLSLLSSCATDGSASLESAESTWTALLACVGEGRPVARSYTREDLPPKLRGQHEPVLEADRAGLTALVQHGETVRGGIRSMIGEGYVIERSDQIQALSAMLAERQVVIVSGVAGSGKSALARQLLTQLQDRFPVLSFQAIEFATAHVDETLANAQTSLNLQRLVALLAGHDRKIVLIDGVERLLEHSVRDGFAQLLQVAQRDSSAQFILTVRDYSLETVRHALIPAGLVPGIFEVPALTDAELDAVVASVSALAEPLGNGHLRTLLRTPYLVDLASRLRWEDVSFPTSLSEFRKRVWQDLIRDDAHTADGMPGRRESVFLDIAWRRAIELRPFVTPRVDDAGALEALRSDSLVETPQNSSAVYCVTHDVLEDWAVLQLIEDRFAEGGDSLAALEVVAGGYPAIRRGLRQWLAERFEKQAIETQALVLSVVTDEDLTAHFRDDCLVAALLSDCAADFVEVCRPRIVEGDFDLLDRLTHVLRVACKASPKWLDVPGLPSEMLEPSGAGWAPTLRLVLDLVDTLLPERTQLALGLVEDWAKQIDWRNPSPEGVDDAGALLERLLPEFEGYSFEDGRKRALKVVVKIPGAVTRFKDLMERARTCTHRDRLAFDLMELVLTKPAGSFVCREFPDEVIALLNTRLRLSDGDKERRHQLTEPAIDEVDYGFGIRSLPMGSYFPASALQGPFSALLRHHPRMAVAYILNLLNDAGRSYATEQWPDRILEPASKTSLAIPNHGTVEQWANGRLYGLYRGNKVGPESIVSALMALESWLLGIGKMEGVDLEGWLLHVLVNSNNVMATGVLASACVAYPEKAGRAGLALLSNRDLVELDRKRLALESNSPWDAFHGLNPLSRVFEQEREEANKLAHREEDLEILAVKMQFGKHREEVWEIIDRHRAEVPEEPREDSRTWRLALHRMDIRGYEPQEAPKGVETADDEDIGNRIYLIPGNVEDDIQELVDETASLFGPIGRYLGLKSLAMKVWERGASAAKLDWRTSLLAEAQAVERELDEPEEFYRDGPGIAAAVCIRDHLAELDKSEFEWCIRRVNFEVRRKSKAENDVDRLGRILSADRMCASVVPLLAVSEREVEGVDVKDLLSVALTHPINEVSEFAFDGLGSFVGEGHKPLVLQCVAAGLHQSRLMHSARVVLRHQRAAGIYDGPNPFESIAPAVRQAIRESSLDFEQESRLLDLDSPVVGTAVRGVLAVFERRANWKESREFYLRLARWLVDSLGSYAGSVEHRPRNFEIELVGWLSLARFVIRLPSSEAMRISAPVLNAVAEQRQQVENFVSELIKCADSNNDDCFWNLWQWLADAVKRSSWGLGLTDESSFGLGLLGMMFLGPYWKEDAKRWHRLDGHPQRVDGLARSLPATIPVMRAYTGYLGRIGHQSLPGSFQVVEEIFENGDAVRIASDSSVAFNLETLLRPFVYSQPHRIKSNQSLRQSVLVILDALVAGGSPSAYRMRDDFVTPSQG